MRVLVLPHIKIHNANALSSPYTIGFPAMTAWLGFAHALERKLNQIGLTDLMLQSTAVVSHQFDLQTFKGEGDFVHSIVGTGNPSVFDEQYKKKWGNSYENKYDAPLTRPAFIEEARCHLDVSLVIECEGDEDALEEAGFAEKLTNIVSTMKIAGGDIMDLQCPIYEFVDENDEQQTAELLRSLMPGYVITERRDLMIEAMQQGQDALDALLAHLTINHSCEQTGEGETAQVEWTSQRKTNGWIVPVATGFQGISELGQAKNQRDPDTPHRFAESIVTLGEFVMAHKIKHLNDMLWHHFPDLENDLYLCQQNNSNIPTK